MIANVFSQSARWLWCLVLVLGPWLYGGTRPWTQDWLTGLGGTGVGLWLLGCLLERRLPRVPWMLVVVSFVLLGLGWSLALNPHLEYRADFFTFVEVPRLVSWLPSGVDGSSAVRKMVQISVLLGGLHLVADLSGDWRFRRQLWVTVGLTGASIALFGLAQRGLQNPIFLWSAAEFKHTHFATYRYHANAGAYLNLVWPLLVGLVVMAFRRDEQTLARTLWVGSMSAVFFGVFVNVSKAALPIAGVLSVFAGIWAWRRLSCDMEWGRGFRNVVLGFAGLLAVLLVLLAWDRWKLGGLQSGQQRLEAYEITWKMIKESGLFGFGPGSWSLCFPFYTGNQEGRIAGTWRFAHEDYLQTLVEWGWVGTSVWAVLVVGGLVAGGATVWRGHDRTQAQARALLFTSGLAVCGVFIHALVDFPLQIASIQLYTVTYLGLAWGSIRWPKVTRKLRVLPENEAPASET